MSKDDIGLLRTDPVLNQPKEDLAKKGRMDECLICRQGPLIGGEGIVGGFIHLACKDRFAYQTALLRKALEVMETLINDPNFHLKELDNCYCPLCDGDETENPDNFIHMEQCPGFIAQALIPKIRAVLENKP